MSTFLISGYSCSTHLPPPAQAPLAGLHAPFAKSKPFVTALLASPRATSAIHTTTFLNLLHVLHALRRATAALREVKLDQARTGHGYGWGTVRARLVNERMQEERRVSECEGRLEELVVELVIMSKWREAEAQAQAEAAAA